ncbi:MAG: baseplate J/gp47 family protein [Acetobacteraceae bacterium]
MQLSLQSFTTLVQNMAAGVQSAASQVLDLTVGSTVRAILEANASIALWLQWLILQVLQSTRAATSAGADLDTWVADFTLMRLPAVAASGNVTFLRFTASGQAVIPPGALVRTSDGQQTFAVVTDATNPAWSSSVGGYVAAAGVASVAVPVSAQAAGSAGNVQPAAIALLATAIPGIDAVTNPDGFANGLDAESDEALRARFQIFIQSRSRATPTAIGYAVASIQQGLQYTLQENLNSAGIPMMGSFVVTVDDGSGNPSNALLTAAQSSIEAVRPVGSTFAVQPPTVILVSVELSVSVGVGAVSPTVSANVATALSAFIDALPIGASLPLTRLAQVAYAADPLVSNVTDIQINGATADLIPAPTSVIKTSSVTVS